jgi:hypothetical protein
MNEGLEFLGTGPNLFCHEQKFSFSKVEDCIFR